MVSQQNFNCDQFDNVRVSENYSGTQGLRVGVKV